MTSSTLPVAQHANLNFLTPYLAVGGDLSYVPPRAEGQALEIMELGITHILDMRIEASDTLFWATFDPEMTYMHLPTDDRADHNIDADLFDRGVLNARKAIREGGVVLAHCHMGINRGPSMAYGILLDQGHSAIEAFDLIRKHRPIAAIAYAEDALKAHMRRRQYTGAEMVRSLRILRSHIADVFGPEEKRVIQHTIRSLHQKDSDEWMEARQEA